MRLGFSFASALVVVAGAVSGVAGCNSNSALPPGQTDMAASRDLAVPMDLAKAPIVVDLAMLSEDPDANGIACGSMTCSQGLICCLSGFNGGQPKASCEQTCDTDGGAIPVLCDGPENCPGGKPCCAQLMGAKAPSAIACVAQSTDCVPDFNMQTFKGQTRLCHISADCTRDAMGATLPDCCTANYSGNKLDICFNANYAAIIGILTKGAVTFVCQ